MEWERADKFAKEENDMRRIFGLIEGGREDVFEDGVWDAQSAKVRAHENKKKMKKSRANKYK